MKKLILVTRNKLLSQKINFWHKKSSLVTRNQFLRQEINSYHKKSILITINQFLSKEISSCEFTSFGFNSQQRMNPNKKFAWVYIFWGIWRPGVCVCVCFIWLLFSWLEIALEWLLIMTSKWYAIWTVTNLIWTFIGF